jgi:hypothetical protein
VGVIVLNRVRIGLGIATIGMGLALVPAIAPASATVSRVSAVSAVSSVRASALCGAYKNEGSSLAKTEGGALAKAMESGNWAAVQKALLASFNSESGAVKNLESALSGAPSNVKAAVATFLKFDGQIKSVVQSSTSLTQFGTQIASLEQSPKVQAALKTMTAYGQKLCPGSIPKTPTT